LVADEPDRIDRLIRVVNERHGHALAMAVEEAKIGLSEEDVARLQMSGFTGGPNPMVHRAAFEAAVEVPLVRIGSILQGVLAMAGVSPAQIGTVFMTGGSSGLPALRALVGDVLPGVGIATGDMLGSVGTGLALDAARRFG
jgi:hypothetical chaperone protein